MHWDSPESHSHIRILANSNTRNLSFEEAMEISATMNKE
jgi:hypothetical protein